MDEAFVYLWYDAGWKQTGGPRYYIGKHKGGLDSGYVCSSNYMKPEWEDRGCKHKGCTHLFGETGHHGDFHRRVLSYGGEKEMIDFEVKLLERRKKMFGNTYYNRVVMWCGGLSGEDSPAYKHGNHGTKKYTMEYYRKYYAANRDKILETKRKYLLDNRDKILDTKRKYRLNNKDKLVEDRRKYYASNKDKILEQQRKYRLANKDKIVEARSKYYVSNKDKLKFRRLQKEKVSEQ